MKVRQLNQSGFITRLTIGHRTIERWRCLVEGPCYIMVGGWVVHRLEGFDEYQREKIRTSTSDRFSKAAV